VARPHPCHNYTTAAQPGNRKALMQSFSMGGTDLFDRAKLLKASVREPGPKLRSGVSEPRGKVPSPRCTEPETRLLRTEDL